MQDLGITFIDIKKKIILNKKKLDWIESIYHKLFNFEFLAKNSANPLL